MNNRMKGALSILLMCASFYMMVTTKYIHALGDYVLEFIRLKAWTGSYSGTHLTVIYFGILFIISLFLVEKYVINGLKIRTWRVFIIFVVLVTIFNTITGMTVKYIKGDSTGLLAIGYNSRSSSINYRSEDNKFVEFTAEIELTNYSSEERSFYLSIGIPSYTSYIKDQLNEINLYTLDGKRAIFNLESKETKLIKLSLDNYKASGGIEAQNGSGSGIIDEIVLTDDTGNIVKLSNDNYFGIELSR